jgi:tetratricopeptide (TPR) repeat protein
MKPQREAAITSRGVGRHCARTRLAAMGAAIAAFCSILPLSAGLAAAQVTAGPPASDTQMRKHYEVAYRLQAAGDSDGAAREHKLFLAEALHHVANARANIGAYSQAEPLYEEALQLAPDDADLKFDYAKAAMDAEDPQKAERLSAEILDQNPATDSARKTWLMRIQAEALRSLGQHQKALELFKSAAETDPSFDNVYALGNAYLWVGDKADGSRIFAGMLAKFGDTAVMRMDLGRGYAEANYFPEAIAEFRKAIAVDNRMHGVHYSLGACYVSLSGEAAYKEAEEEFHKELALQPNDPFSYPQLGKIALSRHNYADAGLDLKRATALNPESADNYLLLSELFTETNRITDAIAALRKAIAITPDPSRNHYAIHAAHYQLGRLLIESGDSAGGKAEMKIAEDLLARSDRQDENTLNGKPQVQLPLETTRVASTEERAEDSAYEKSVAPLIAGSYNNLGVHAAIHGDFGEAAGWFCHASEWNPTLAGVPANWGRAAFAAHQYAEAVAPLQTALRVHPGDQEMRVELGVSQCETGDYSGAKKTLSPIASSLAGNPSLAALYADCAAKVGRGKSDESKRAEGNNTPAVNEK